MAKAEPGELRYKAFLSYSHKDAAVAAKLHRRLETYRLPRRLVGTETPRGPVPARLWPIFRDREELPAATDLSETVRAALAESASLIVLCSPHAAASLWVAEEIETFRRLYPERPILAAIVDGEPGECFPAALRAFGEDGTWHEPLATDLRPEGDGPQLGLLKLVAGITGVGLDALVQRDAQRKVRRVTAVTAAALLALLLMTGLTVFALNARAEAERQRAEVGRQIEFMLTDLRDRLEGVGRLDIMTVVNQHALDYYSRQQLDELGPDSLARRARVLHAIGEDDLNRGDFPRALAAFREAHRTTSEQLERAPNDADRIFAHAQSDYWIGRIHDLTQNWADALPYYRRYAAAAQRLHDIAPDNPDYMMEMGWGALNLGIVQFHNQETGHAETSFRTALRWFGRVAALRPADENVMAEQANGYAWLADTYYVRRRWAESLAERLEEYRLKDRLYRYDPSNSERLYRLASAERAVARSYWQLGDRSRSHDFLIKAHASVSRLAARDRGNATWMLLMIKVECDLLRQTSIRQRGIADGELRASIRANAAALELQRNPRLHEASECIRTVA